MFSLRLVNYVFYNTQEIEQILRVVNFNYLYYDCFGQVQKLNKFLTVFVSFISLSFTLRQVSMRVGK